MQMNIRFELQPKQRPKLAEAIAAALHTIPCYQKAPTLSYKIGDCTLEKDGTLRIPDTVDTETVNALLTHLQEKGFTGQMEETEDRLIVGLPFLSLPHTHRNHIFISISSCMGFVFVSATRLASFLISSDRV